MAKCEGCEQEKDVKDIEGNILCDECTKDIVRCDFCNKLLAVSMDDLETNCGALSVPELTLPDMKTSQRFCDVDCLEGYVKKYKKEQEILHKLEEIKRDQKDM
jgi:phage FluMu protein Com